MYEIKYFDEIKSDLDKLPEDIYDEVVKYFRLYQIDPFVCSKALYGKLANYRKTFVANATYRIVIKVENNIVKIVSVIAVGQREDSRVYEEVIKRVTTN